MSHSVEVIREIWNDITGTKITVGPDRDGLNLIMVRSYSDDEVLLGEIVLNPEEARLVTEAIYKCVNEIEKVKED